MRKNIYIIMFFTLVVSISCSSIKYYDFVKYKFQEDFPLIVLGNIPNTYINLKKIEIQNKNYDIEYHYIYSDSSMLYISNAKTFSFPNYKNIQRINTINSALRLQDDYAIQETNRILIEKNKTPLPRAPHFMIFKGKDNNGLYWKDIKYGNISIGYLGVPENKKEIFDTALESFKIK